MAMRRARADVMSLQRPASAGHVPLATDADARASPRHSLWGFRAILGGGKPRQ